MLVTEKVLSRQISIEECTEGEKEKAAFQALQTPTFKGRRETKKLQQMQRNDQRSRQETKMTKSLIEADRDRMFEDKHS